MGDVPRSFSEVGRPSLCGRATAWRAIYKIDNLLNNFMTSNGRGRGDLGFSFRRPDVDQDLPTKEVRRPPRRGGNNRHGQWQDGGTQVFLPFVRKSEASSVRSVGREAPVDEDELPTEEVPKNESKTMGRNFLDVLVRFTVLFNRFHESKRVEYSNSTFLRDRIASNLADSLIKMIAANSAIRFDADVLRCDLAKGGLSGRDRLPDVAEFIRHCLLDLDPALKEEYKRRVEEAGTEE
jgi:hypothetical protein